MRKPVCSGKSRVDEVDKTMHARLTTRQIEPGKIDEAIGIYRDTVVPAVRERQGSKGGLVMADRGTGKVMTISLWELPLP